MKVTTSQIRSDIDLAVALRIAISRLARRIRAERAAGGLPELSDTQFAALAVLVRHATMTPGELAEHEKVQPPSMTRVIAVLEERGLLTRAAHPADKRQVALTATAAGRSLVEQVRRLREAWLARRLRELSTQERSVLRAAAPVLEKLSQS
jgi:DNA-binding MarR family transcriptional regulator